MLPLIKLKDQFTWHSLAKMISNVNVDLQEAYLFHEGFLFACFHLETI